MILNNAPANEAIVSNVGSTGEFRIRNSAKAFNILSSGLYANKIRAVIRELSCNAVDSHVAAGRPDTPFDVHLPTQLEPHFSIRDYGTGLNHEQIQNIYTTYFESTKTDSNAFIGALGLGSKSPFSYTDNFTVTAIKDGKKGIYTSYIGNEGVPTIALMMSEDTDEPTGVEVKFAVSDSNDYNRFAAEATHVFCHFKLLPVISGRTEFKFAVIEYESKDIIPGVHARWTTSKGAIAVMGNIAYPIDVPNSESALGSLQNLVKQCSLEMHFNIGELDFQASREGLSYIPSTIDAIRNKLQALNDALTVVLAKEADAEPNLWKRAVLVAGKRKMNLWIAAADQYITQNAATVTTIDVADYYRLKKFALRVKDIEAKFNIRISGTLKPYAGSAMKTLKVSTGYDKVAPVNGVAQNSITYKGWSIAVDLTTRFVTNTAKTGGLARTKFHYKTDNVVGTIYVLEKADKAKDMDLKGFFAEIANPPEENIFDLQTLRRMTPEKRNRDKVTLVTLMRAGGKNARKHYVNDWRLVWRDAGDATELDANVTRYYLPMNGFEITSQYGFKDGKDLYNMVEEAQKGLLPDNLYGVRKSDLDWVKAQKNWVNFEEAIKAKLTAPNSTIIKQLIKSKLTMSRYEADVYTQVIYMIDSASPLSVLINDFKNINDLSGSYYNLAILYRTFAPARLAEVEDAVPKYQKMVTEVQTRYPLLNHIDGRGTPPKHIADYIKMCDGSVKISIDN